VLVFFLKGPNCDILFKSVFLIQYLYSTTTKKKRVFGYRFPTLSLSFFFFFFTLVNIEEADQLLELFA